MKLVRGVYKSPRTSDFPVPVEPKMTTRGSTGGTFVDIALVTQLCRRDRIGDVSVEKEGSLITES